MNETVAKPDWLPRLEEAVARVDDEEAVCERARERWGKEGVARAKELFAAKRAAAKVVRLRPVPRVEGSEDGEEAVCSEEA